MVKEYKNTKKTSDEKSKSEVAVKEDADHE
jgi:hypothetical protein